MRRTVLLFLILAGALHAVGQERVSVAFYNVENLFDTIPSLFYDDSDYTPSGRNRWDTERYRRKTAHIARVIDEMAADVIALAEVESEEVVRDLVAALHTDYNYIHRTSGDRRGMDLALLYKGDKFFPRKTVSVPAVGREFLHVSGRLRGVDVEIVVCHLPSNFNGSGYRSRAMQRLYDFVQELHRSRRTDRIIVLGDFNASTTDKIMRRHFATGRRVADGNFYLFNPLHEAARKGAGSYVYHDRWVLFDYIFLGSGFGSDAPMRYLRAGIFVRGYLLAGTGDASRFAPGSAAGYGYPLRTFSAGKYLGGYSDHLPVFCYFEL